MYTLQQIQPHFQEIYSPTILSTPLQQKFNVSTPSPTSANLYSSLDLLPTVSTSLYSPATSMFSPATDLFEPLTLFSLPPISSNLQLLPVTTQQSPTIATISPTPEPSTHTNTQKPSQKLHITIPTKPPLSTAPTQNQATPQPIPPRKLTDPCPTCQKRFTRASDLTRHMWSHSKTKPYKCTYENCKKSFLQSSALKVHIRTHTGEKPFVCGVEGCVRAFSDSSSCSRHRRHHLKLKPYQCTFKGCLKSFTRNETLQKHYESQHSEDNTENGVMSESGNEEMRSEASPMSFVSESPQIEITEYPYDLSGTNVTNTDYFDSTGMMSPYFNTEEFGMMGVDANGNGIPGMGSSALSPMVSSSLTMPPMGMDGCNLVSPMVEESPMDFGFENFVRVFPVYVGDDGVHYVGVEGDKYFVEKKLLGDGAN